MGEYAEQYTLETFGVDISQPERKRKQLWKWACPICRKNLASKAAQTQHISTKHKKRLDEQRKE